MAGPVDNGDHVTLDSTSFNGGAAVTLKASTSRALVLSGIDLTYSGGTAISSLQIREIISRTVHYATHLPIAPTAANGTSAVIRAIGIRISVAANQGLEIVGGATSGVLNGTVYITEAPA